VSVEANDDIVRVAVSDTGPGIPREYRERVFEKFGQVEAVSRGQKFSTGLGLTFCRLAVEAHGGRIGVDSEVGRGSTFWFVLPRKGLVPRC
jgi:signal transduction histidine kinase